MSPFVAPKPVVGRRIGQVAVLGGCLLCLTAGTDSTTDPGATESVVTIGTPRPPRIATGRAHPVRVYG